MEKEIENLIEELTKVRPSMLNEEALKLFNTIMAVLDERDNLKERNKKLEAKVKRYGKYLENKDKKFKEALENEYQERETDYIPKSKIKEKIDKIEMLRGVDGITYDHIILELEELMEDK